MRHAPISIATTAAVCALLLIPAVPAQPRQLTRAIAFETTRVTDPDIAVSHDGRWLVFTILGHLFRLPSEGGTADQLTFGPYYDSDPVISSEGRRIAFVSNRDGSQGNIFLLDLATTAIAQVTEEPWAGRPTWTPDGNAIVYLSFAYEPGQSGPPPASVRRIDLKSGTIETISPSSRRFRSVFHLPDGRLAWTVLDELTADRRAKTRIETVTEEGIVNTLATLPGIVDRAVFGSAGDEIYVRRYTPLRRPYLPTSDELLSVAVADSKESLMLPLPNVRGARPSFALSRADGRVYVGQGGRLWKLDVRTRARRTVPFLARVTMEVLLPVEAPGDGVRSKTASPRVVLHPRLSPSGKRLVFGAAGYLWEQLDEGRPANRILEGDAFEQAPAISPDGKRLAFIRSSDLHPRGQREREIVLFEFASGRTRVVASGARYLNLGWSRDGERLIFDEAGSETLRRLVAMRVDDGSKEVLYQPRRASTIGWWSPRYDGESAYFTDPTGGAMLLRLPLRTGLQPHAFLPVPVGTRAGVLSPDKQWIAVWRRTGIWLTPAGEPGGTIPTLQELTPDGGATFSFTPDGTAIVYATGPQIWRHALPDGPPDPVPVRLSLPRPVSPAILLRGVRVLDFRSGGFTSPTSLLLQDGRIRWIGPERGRTIPHGAIILDVGERFAIPGLFEMHAHLAWAADPRTFLAYGITTVRDVGAQPVVADLYWIAALSDRGEATHDPIPRVAYAGELLADWLVQNEENARTLVMRMKRAGASLIKVHPPISWRLERAVAEQARTVGLPLVGHGTTVEEVVKGVTLGFASIEHTINHNRSYDDVLQLLAATGTHWTPTLGAGGFNDLLVRDEPERLEDAKLRTLIPEACIEQARTGSFMRGIETRTLRRSWAEQLSGVRDAHRAGVKLLVGTDSFCGLPQSVGPEGLSLHWELEHFVAAGLTPLDVLRLATQGAAAALAIEQELGTIEPGKLADIVLLDASPLEDIRNTRRIWRVIKDGWVYDPETIARPR